MLPPQFQTGTDRPGGCQTALEDAILRPPECHAQPSENRLPFERRGHSALFQNYRVHRDGCEGPFGKEALHRKTSLLRGKGTTGAPGHGSGWIVLLKDASCHFSDRYGGPT